MNIIVTSLCLILIGISMVHPVFFMQVDKQVLQGNISRRFLQTNYILHIISGVLSVLIYWIYSVSYTLQLSGLVYLIVIFVVSLFYWNSELTKWNLFTASIVFGFIVFFRSVKEIVEITPIWPGIFTGLLGACILSILLFLLIEAFFHSEYNSENPLRYRMVKYLFFLLGIRIFWQIVILFNLSVATQYGDVISALQFFWQADPFKLLTLVFFSMIIPVFYLLFLKRRISENSVKKRWLLLIVLIASVFTAEFLSKYFLLQFGIVL